jgi:putative hydrolase of the HAD superfamily
MVRRSGLALNAPHTIESMTNEAGTRINAVLFDYGRVLSGPPDPNARQQMERILGVNEETLRAAYWKYRDAYDRGALGGQTYWPSVARELGRQIDAKGVTALIDADNALWTQPNLPMIEWAASLQRAGIKTGILSNLGDVMETGIRARFAWLAEFTHHTFSHRLGIAKPDLAIYLHAAEGLDVPIDEILFIDDKEENIAGAQTAGMVAVQYDSHDSFVQALRQLGLDALLSPEIEGTESAEATRLSESAA